ncbi:MBL fold metallo-hydrolase [Nitrogeniibacter mangrovi]|uniref:MBL fold metallo-hydrolase n=1 Tax=Nitrogeniibacter mangrovi TaxID=2016596 RepID=A0A6C1B4K9_9RHOO|nr:MBL fold metallo-hydrolase [Nitrogeniibacter mangrovi]QID18622.1 MBL fold metallo-hydrolase [Nitrogeniibacter mangrovi]
MNALRTGFALFLLLAVALFPPPLRADEAITLTPIQVGPHSWYFQGESGAASAANKGFMSNAGFVVTDDQVIVWDSLGTPVLGQAMITAIRKLTALPIKLVIASHYHADHIYGLQAFKALGADIWAHQNSRLYLASDVARERLAQRRDALFPWVNEDTHLVPPDRTLPGGENFTRGGLHFRLIDAHGSHAPDDMMLLVEEDGVLFSGDLFFDGRVPFVGDANTRHWLKALDSMLDSHPKVVVPGHGHASKTPQHGITLTRDYLIDLRQKMGAAVADLTDFETAYAAADWSRWQKLPAFEAANRLNAYNVYIQMEQEALQGNR